MPPGRSPLLWQEQERLLNVRRLPLWEAGSSAHQRPRSRAYTQQPGHNTPADSAPGPCQPPLLCPVTRLSAALPESPGPTVQSFPSPPLLVGRYLFWLGRPLLCMGLNCLSLAAETEGRSVPSVWTDPGLLQLAEPSQLCWPRCSCTCERPSASGALSNGNSIAWKTAVAIHCHRPFSSVLRTPTLSDRWLICHCPGRLF